MEHNPMKTFTSIAPAPKTFGHEPIVLVTNDPMSALDWTLAALVALLIGFCVCLVLFPIAHVDTVVTADGVAYTVTTQLAADVDKSMQDMAYVMAKNVCPTMVDMQGLDWTEVRKAYRCADFGL